jgi:pyridoxal phosphate enzyme, YggS family
MSIADRLQEIKKTLPDSVKLVAVSKLHPASLIQEAYDTGQRIFGENRAQEIVPKYNELPKDIEWHFIGHLQGNKVKYIVPFVHLIHSVDSLKLLKEVNKEAAKFNRQVNVLLQIHIAQEEHKFGFSFEEAESLFRENGLAELSHIQVCGLMGMASLTDDDNQIRKEFAGLSSFFQRVKKEYFSDKSAFFELSMGMSDDYPIAIEEGSTLVRIGSKIFGARN